MCVLSDVASTYVVQVWPSGQVRRVRELCSAPVFDAVLWEDRALLIRVNNDQKRTCDAFPLLTDILAIDAAFSGDSLCVVAIGEDSDGMASIHANGQPAAEVPGPAQAIGLVHETDPHRPPSVMAVLNMDKLDLRDLSIVEDWSTENWL